jgi:hypothetical protein
MASASSAARDKRTRVRVRASRMSQGANSGRVTMPPRDLGDLQSAGLAFVAFAQHRDHVARLVLGVEAEHLADALGLQRGVGRKEQSFHDVDGLRHLIRCP